MATTNQLDGDYFQLNSNEIIKLPTGFYLSNQINVTHAGAFIVIKYLDKVSRFPSRRL
jgi:hypothetical protein